MASPTVRVNPNISGYPGEISGNGSGSSHLILANSDANTPVARDADNWDGPTPAAGVNIIQCQQCYAEVDVYVEGGSSAGGVTVVGRFRKNDSDDHVWLPLRAHNVKPNGTDPLNIVAEGDHADVDTVTQVDGDTYEGPFSFYLFGAEAIVVLPTAAWGGGSQLWIKLSTGA